MSTNFSALYHLKKAASGIFITFLDLRAHRRGPLRAVSAHVRKYAPRTKTAVAFPAALLRTGLDELFLKAPCSLSQRDYRRNMDLVFCIIQHSLYLSPERLYQENIIFWSSVLFPHSHSLYERQPKQSTI